MITFKKTRIAPTPSGYLHLGNIYSFALTAALARQTGAKIMLRIDDLDRDRVLPEYVEDIFDTLRFMDIPWDEGPASSREFEQQYSQIHRLDMYRQALQRLQENDLVFACICSRAQLGKATCACKDKNLPLDTPNAAWRLNTSNSRQFIVRVWSGGKGLGKGEDAGGDQTGADQTGAGRIGATLPVDMQDFIVRKKDGFPAYQLTSVLDDLHYGIDLIVRGDDLWPSTLAQIYLSGAFPDGSSPDVSRPASAHASFGEIHFHHHPLLSGPDGEKLSKSAGATSIQYLRKQGNTPTDIYTMIARILGSPDARPATWQDLIALAPLSQPLK